MKLVWRSKALEDRKLIASYIAQDNVNAAIELDIIFEEKAEIARSNPKLYKPGRIRGSRELVVNESYVMVYRVNEKAKTVTFARVLHTSRKWP